MTYGDDGNHDGDDGSDDLGLANNGEDDFGNDDMVMP